ncbi:MAG: hypothetical protein ACKOXW_07300 [Actinomycetes bacterium]
MSNRTAMIERAANSARALRRLNIVTLCVAVAVYIGLLTIAVFQQVGPLAVFSSCVMLAELLVFQIVRTLTNHLDLLR